jgi:hypothetical protein
LNSTGGIEVAELADPGVIPYHQLGAIVPAQNGIVPDIDVGADAHVRGPDDQSPLLEDDILTDRSQV